MTITIEHYGKTYSAQIPDECDMQEFYDALRAVVRCIWEEDQTADIFNEERTAEGGPIHGVPDDYLLS